jgi:transposase-like protein
VREFNPTAYPADRQAAPVAATPMCPVCRSEKVSTTSKTVNETTYWRCHGCGEIWNQSRLASFGRRR